MSPFVIVLIVIVGLGALALLVWSAQQRKKALAALAAAWGFTWCDKDPFEIASRFDAFAALGRGRSQRAYNVFHGARNGRQVICFDFRYTTGSGKSSATHNLSGAIIDIGVTFPFLLVRPEGVFDKLAEFVGFDDIDFESAEFSRAYYVKSEDRKFAYDIFHARAMEYMLAQPRKFSLEFRGNIVVVTDDSVWGPESFNAAIAQVEGLLALTPEFVARELRPATT